MSRKAGALLWNRMRFTLPPGIVTVNGFLPSVTDIDTGLTQPNRSFPDYSPNEPDLGQRTQVMPMAPTDAWGSITHGEPVLDPATGTVHVTFFNNSLNPAEINALFWDPHSIVGPGDADTYNSPPPLLVLSRGPGT